jgi:ribonuclease HII
MADTPSSSLWQHDLARGRRFVIGADEAGRGAWAGPIAGAAVAIDMERVDIAPLLALNDSKKLSPSRREALREELRRQQALGHLIIRSCVVSPQGIDRFGIQRANEQVLALPISQARQRTSEDALVLVDAFSLKGAESIVKGDSTSAAIAAASIIAKCLRDQIMHAAGERWPAWQFAAHKGYGSAVHRQMLDEHGPSVFHRMSFRPMKDLAAGMPAESSSQRAVQIDDEWAVEF